MMVESSKAKTRINHQRQKKTTSRTKNGRKNSKLLLLRKFDFDPEEILDKLLLFDLKKTSKDKNLTQCSKNYQTKTISITSKVKK